MSEVLFNKGKFEDWEVVCVDSATYTIYRKDCNQEWQDEKGDNLCFETKKEAVAYLEKVFEGEVPNVTT